jgi:hypothetical protein
LKILFFSCTFIRIITFFAKGEWVTMVFSQRRLVTPLASAKGWRQRQLQRFARTRQKMILKKILRQLFSVWLYKNTEKNQTEWRKIEGDKNKHGNCHPWLNQLVQQQPMMRPVMQPTM